MAAAEEDGGQSDSKNDDSASHDTSRQFSTIHQEIESQLVRPGASYENRVSAVLSGWEHLAGTVQDDVSHVQTLATFLYRWSLRLILQGEWPGLAQIVKTRLGVTLQRCSRVAVLEPLCHTLLPLVSDPWGHQTKTILSDSEVDDEEAIRYVSSESWEVIRVRVDTMVESRCEELAFRVLKVCVRCIRLRSEGREVPLYTDEDHNHFVDLYFVLLYKFQRKAFLDEVKALDVNEGVNLVRRLLDKPDKTKVWKHRLKIADLAVQIFLATTIVKKYSSQFWSVFHEWCGVQEASTVGDDLISQMIRKYIQLSDSSCHMYDMASILHQKFGTRLVSLVTELLIRALTMDLNSLEALKLSVKDGNVKELEQQMAAGFMDLATVFTNQDMIARECYLTAFSLHPTPDRLALLGRFANRLSAPQAVPPPHSEVLLPPQSPHSKRESNVSGSPSMLLSPTPSNSAIPDAHNNLHGVDEVKYSPTPSAVTQEVRTQESLRYLSLENSSNIDDVDDKSHLKDLKISCQCNEEGKQSVDNVSEVKGTWSCVSNFDKLVKKEYSLPTDHPPDPPKDGSFEPHIVVDTGQPKGTLSGDHDTHDSEMHSFVKYAQSNTDENTLLQTKEGSGVDEADEYSVSLEAKIKDDVDSMDKFFESTESFIEQLSQDSKKLTNIVNNVSFEDDTCSDQNYDVITHPNRVLDGVRLGLSKEMCDDLAVVLSSPRWQVLSWRLDWQELQNICERYMIDADGAKNTTKELKYLNLDYSQFENMPSAEITEFSGIEKGYEHFVEYESEGEVSDGGIHRARAKGSHQHFGGDSDAGEFGTIVKRGRGRPKKIQTSRVYDSDSDYDSNERQGSSCFVASPSESEESDIDPKCKTRILKMGTEIGTIIEGKRVTAVSSQDRSKRIRIDDTGKLKRDRNLLNTLRLFRHHKYGGDPSGDGKYEGAPRSPNHFAPRLSSLNLNPTVVLTERDKSAVDRQLQKSMTTVAGSKHGPGQTTMSSQSQGSWRYAGSLVAPPNQTSNVRPTAQMSLPRSTSVQCYLRTKDGKVRITPLQRTLQNTPRRNTPGGYNNLLRMINPSSGYESSYAKFLLEKSSALKGSSVTVTRKNMSLDASLDYLKKQGTTVTYKSQNRTPALNLANAQKNVLNQIMSPENTLSAMSGNFNESLPVRAIAMPVSNNPPNLPPSDKNSPANLSRVLPKGTTVVRKPKTDGAGPSGVNNGGTSSGISPRTVVTRPGNFSTIVSRPSVTVTNAALRTGNSVLAVRANTAAIRTTYSRGVVVSSSLGVQEAAVNSSPSPTPTIESSSPTTSTDTVGLATPLSMPAPLVSATVVGSVPNSVTSNLSSPMGTLGGNNGQQQQLQHTWDAALNEGVCASETPLTNVVSGTDNTGIITQIISSTRGATTCTTTVASPPGDVRAASMLETLLRDRPVPPSPLHIPITTATTTITAALPQTLTSVVGCSSLPITASGEGQVTSAVMGALPSSSNSSGNVVIAGGSSNSSGVIVASGMVGGATGSGVVVASGGVVSGSGVVSAGNTVGESGSGAVQQVLLPGQLVQVHTSDGSTGLGIVHSASLDLRLPAGTRVIKSSSGAVRAQGPQQQQLAGVINQPSGRQVNVLHNVKILQNVQNRQIVRTVVVPHTVALQGLSAHQATQLKPQLVALGQGTNTSSASGSGDTTVIQTQPQAASTTVRAKIPPSTIVQKVLGRSGLVIRTLRPQVSTIHTPAEITPFEEGLGAKMQQQQQTGESDKSTSSTSSTVTVARLPQDEGLGERLSHYLKTALVSSTSTQSVGTQTLTTAVKPSAGQLVNQVAMNNLRSAGAALSSGVQGTAGQPSTISTSPTPSQQGNLSSLPITPTNAVSSETLEQLREFESVFEKVSNKSGKDGNEGEASVESYSSTTMSSEESMIAAQLLSMANDTPTVATSSNYVCSVPSTVYDSGSTRLTEGTYITIPSSTQAGTLILVNHSSTGTGLVTVAGGVQGQPPPPAASPTLSSTSSHSSIASSPSSTSSKSKKQPPKTKVVPPSTPPVAAKPKTPPPPKAPTPKPTVAKPQVEESDETKARIQAILEQYKQDLANTPQPQPAPRNRKNCPPPKNDGKSSTKKKGQVKKTEGGAGNSPAVSEGSTVGCPSPSPSPGPASDSSVGLPATASGVQAVQYSAQVVAGQSVSTPSTPTAGSAIISEDKIKVETGQQEVSTGTPQLLQGVVVSNVKVESANIGSGTSSLPQGLTGGRVVQLIHHGGKVTAITTRQPLNKVKGTGQSGPPPNVTIQGRINMNDLMESHIASLLTGGSSPIGSNPTVVSKIVQQQQTGSHQAVQQVIVQASGGQPVLQQVAVQQLPSPQKSQQQQTKSGVIQQIGVASNEELLRLTPPSRPLQANISSAQSVSTSTSTVSNISTLTNSSPIVSPSVISSTPGNPSTPTSGPSSLSGVPASPLTPQAVTVTSPPTPQAVAASPHTPSPATDLPPTPSSFHIGEESSSSEQSVSDGLAGPLPPFFTLKSFIMQQPQQQSQLKQAQQKQSSQEEEEEKNFSAENSLPNNSGGAACTTQVPSPATGSAPLSKPSQRGNQSSNQLSHSQLPRKPASVIRSGVGASRTLIVGGGDGNGRAAVPRVTTASPLLLSAVGDTVIASSPRSGTSSLESSPSATQSRIRLASRPQDTRSSSIDSMKSDNSVEEVQIPPSPATLTKQLQSAYMTEAALSPSVSQSQHSGSSYSSPGTTHDLPFTETPSTSDDNFSTSLPQPGYSSAPSAPGLSVTGVSLENDGGLGSIASPSGDVYLHHSGTGLGLESLDTGALPLVAGMEVRTHSPALSDLVSAGPLLTWSPRSADSIMVQSPSLNDALTANIPLDNHSEDSLCDSSTGFPGLFSMEGDGVSVSSSTSEDMRSTTPVGISNAQQQQQHDLQEQVEVTIDLHPQESEQDHTITSTRSPTQLELPVTTLGSVSSSDNHSARGIVASQAPEDTPWRFDNTMGPHKPAGSQVPGPHGTQPKDEKQELKLEETPGPSDFCHERLKGTSRSSQMVIKEKKVMPVKIKEEQEDMKVVTDIANRSSGKEKRSSAVEVKTDVVESIHKISNLQEGNNKKRSQRLAVNPERRRSNFQNDIEVNEEIPTKNGHEDSNLELKVEDNSNSAGKSKRKSSQRNPGASPNPVIQSANRNRSKPIKGEMEVKVEGDLSVTDTEIREEKLIVKSENDSKEVFEEVMGRTTRGAKRRSDGDNLGELKRGRGTRSARHSDGDVLKMEDEVLNHLDEDCVLTRGLRGRHVSGTSDTSSNYSLEHAITLGPHDSPGISGSRRRRRLSRESSASSRDGSPPVMHTHDFSPSGMNTRRSSSRDHAKKKKCSCCVGGEQKKGGSGGGGGGSGGGGGGGGGSSGGSGGSRRSSARATRGTSSGTVQ